ncbi:MAG: glycosyltransferase family 39 protein [Roseofilum sp. SBFL]|uniref:glycosyltransferase family 39 protein n=1 Tax=unclassified Roseofilum TaxID=2620099 RepID=UPI001B02BC19|nr:MULTISPECIES: glycosyltransferase family 39 protein [unclassified Roseofilum]MBP0038173.1 glycosyltransferase family 39 protein [Roseofilum sp. SID1]MBP0043487.1 glycosyltransferase family 39 protein [Roseofilum sp. SBFL]
MKHSFSWLSIISIAITGYLVGMLGFSIWDQPPMLPTPVNWSAQVTWIGLPNPSYRLYTRQTLNLPDRVKRGWLRLSADNDFRLYVNGKVLTQEVSILRNTLGLGGLVQDWPQKLNDFRPFPSLRPEWVYLRAPKDWKMTFYVDLTHYLQPGKNAIAVEVQSSQQHPRLLLEGKIYPVGDLEKAIDISTGSSPWKVSERFQSRQRLHWFDADFPDQTWPLVTTLDPPNEATYSRLSPLVFDRPLTGSWITGSLSPSGETWLRTSWSVSVKPQQAWMRWVAQDECSLLINGLLVHHYPAEDSQTLHLSEVSRFLHPGINTLAVHLTPPLTEDWHVAFNEPPQRKIVSQFWLDGWVENAQGTPQSTIQTDSSWQSLATPVADWELGKGSAEAAIKLNLPDPQHFLRLLEGDSYALNYPHWLWHQSLWWGLGCLFILIYSFLLGAFWQNVAGIKGATLDIGTGLLFPGTMFLSVMELLKHRYGISERWLIFAQPHSDVLILLGFLGVVCLTLLWSCIVNRHLGLSPTPISGVILWSLWFILTWIGAIALGLALADNTAQWPMVWIVASGFILWGLSLLFWQQTQRIWTHGITFWQQHWPQWGYQVVLVAITLGGFILRAYRLDAMDLEADEYTSLDATRGILATGAPVTTSGIWYTRGPIFHYLLALWLRWVGDSTMNARFLSVLFGTATLVVIFFLTRAITGKTGLALVVMAILAIDPWELWYSRFIRFYQVLQFVTLINIWFLIKGFIEGKQKRYQYLFYVGVIIMLLIQEGSLTLLPGLFLCFLCSYFPLEWREDKSIAIGCFAVMGVYAYNIGFFIVKCLTPVVAISTTTDSYLKPRLSDVTGFFTNFFIGPNWMNLIYTVLFIAGLVYFLQYPQKVILCLYTVIGVNLLCQTLLVYVVAARYFYPIYPLFIILSLYGATCLIGTISQPWNQQLSSQRVIQKMTWIFLAILLLGNLEVEKVVGAYSDAIAIRNTEILDYIQSHKQPGDIIISNTSAVYTSIGGLDYYIPHRLSIFDAVYARNGEVIDRWGGGKLLTDLDQLNSILSNHNRVWIHQFDRLQPPKSFLHAKEHNLYKTLGDSQFETFGAQVKLWKPEN